MALAGAARRLQALDVLAEQPQLGEDLGQLGLRRPLRRRQVIRGLLDRLRTAANTSSMDSSTNATSAAASWCAERSGSITRRTTACRR